LGGVEVAFTLGGANGGMAGGCAFDGGRWQ